MEPRRLMAADLGSPAEGSIPSDTNFTPNLSDAGFEISNPIEEEGIGVKYFAEVFDSEDHAVSAFEIDVPYTLKVSIQDVSPRGFGQIAGGVFSVAVDLVFDDHIVVLDQASFVSPFIALPSPPMNPAADLTLTAFWSLLQPPGAIRQPLLEFPFVVQTPLATQFSIAPAITTPEHSLLFGQNVPIPRDGVSPASVLLTPFHDQTTDDPVIEPAAPQEASVPDPIDQFPLPTLVSFNTPIENDQPEPVGEFDLAKTRFAVLAPQLDGRSQAFRFRKEIEETNRWIEGLLFGDWHPESEQDEKEDAFLELEDWSLDPTTQQRRHGKHDVVIPDDEQGERSEQESSDEDRELKQDQLDELGWKALFDQQVDPIEPSLSKRQSHLHLYSPDADEHGSYAETTDRSMIDLAALIRPDSNVPLELPVEIQPGRSAELRLAGNELGIQIHGNRAGAVMIDYSRPESESFDAERSVAAE